MGAKERKRTAIAFTQSVLMKMMDAPETLIQMIAWDVEPEALEKIIAKILEYLEKNKEETSHG